MTEQERQDEMLEQQADTDCTAFYQAIATLMRYTTLAEIHEMADDIARDFGWKGEDYDFVIEDAESGVKR